MCSIVGARSVGAHYSSKSASGAKAPPSLGAFPVFDGTRVIILMWGVTAMFLDVNNPAAKGCEFRTLIQGFMLFPARDGGLHAKVSWLPGLGMMTNCLTRV